MPNVDHHEPGTPSWFDLMTTDPEKARAFYGALFGWTFEVGPPESGFYTMCLKNGRPAAGIGKKPDGAPFPPAWTVYMASADADATTAAVREKGGAVVMGPMDVMEEGRMAIYADPTGAVFGVWQPKRHTGSRVTGEHGAMAWCEVNTRKGPEARDFYAGVLGLKGRQIEGMEYWTLHRGEEAVCGVLQMNEKWPADVPPHWMAYFAVDDTDAALEKVKELGGVVCVPPFDTPYGRMAVINDPAGAALSIIQLPRKPA